MPSALTAITSRSNPRVKALRLSLSGKASQAGDLLGIEGLHLIGELHASGHNFEAVYVREGSESALEVGWPSRLRAGEHVILSRDVFDSAVTTATPQGIAATWLIRDPSRPEGARNGNVLVLENLQDPGNVGTLIRSAEAFGFDHVIATQATTNHWNPKVVRSSAGSVFRLPVLHKAIEEAAAQFRRDGTRLFAAVGAFLGAHTPGRPLESLHGRPENTISDGQFRASLSLDADFVEPCAILIGNEGAGLSSAARALCDEQVRIPCAVESLNAAVAGSVLMYEVTRQRPLRAWAREKGLRP